MQTRLKPRYLIPATLVVILISTVWHFRDELTLYWHTAPEFHARFEKIERGQTRSEVEEILGKPAHHFAFEDSLEYYLGWPRDQHTTYAVKFRDGHVIASYDRFGSF
ncbi:outer membrane protein assembly factor BamE [Gimesia benthica]|uniref:Outer membrane protein assembly factor BamE n=1 Tax=Gimesia benthica TaxID=2608982 RepID=A0A6I6ADI5_9PLAN|nr:outer membrane protein assembly factor BamE [Gimesia benthica]QGQ23435.1 outer membrane protein assembly factor BamE [Gimesia benthica]